MSSPGSPQEAWSRLQGALDQLLDWHSPSIPLGPNEALQLYSSAYYYCTEKRAPRPGAPYYLAYFYGEDLHHLLKEYLSSKLQSFSQEVTTLSALLTGWKRIEQVCPLLELIFFYMERHWLDRLARESIKLDAQKGPVQTIPLLYALWDLHVLQPLEASLVQPCFREHWHQPTSELVALCAMYRTVSAKHTSSCDGLVMEAAVPQAMEQRLMKWWRQLLSKQTKQLLETHADPQAMLHATMILAQQEQERVNSCVANHPIAMRLTRQAWRQELLRPLVERLEPIMVPLMSEREPNELLSLIYNALKDHRSVLADLFDALESAWLERYQVIFRTEDRVEGLVAFVKDAQLIWQDCFQHDERLRDVMNTTIEAICLEQQLAVHWPLHIDRLMRAGLQRVEEACSLLHWIKERDFMAIEYYRLLLHRLLDDPDSVAAEGAALEVLSKHLADALLQPCHTLLKDTAESHRFYEEWLKEHKRTRHRPHQVTVVAPKTAYTRSLYLAALTQEWPTCLSLDAFTTSYVSKYPSRKLQWSSSLSTVEIQVNGVLVTLSVQQYLLLEKIMAGQTVSHDGCLQPMVEAGLLSASLAFNPNFTATSPVNLAPHSHVTTAAPEVHSAPPESVQIDRRGLLDAAIVRLVKRSKHLSLATLMAQCRQELCNFFEPSEGDMEKELASLVEREYIARDHKTMMISYCE